VVSHDRYFLERTVDSVWALLDDGQISMLPRGVDEYLERRSQALHIERLASPSVEPVETPAARAPKAAPGSAEEREARKALARIDKQLERMHGREAELNAAIVEAGQDYERLTELSAQLDVLAAEREALEHEWLEAAEALE
jgi:ATP-binding cassette subfamily F protein uup